MNDARTAIQPTVSFVVPALNEQDNLEPTVNTLVVATDGLLSNYEIILVNDGSTDQTAQVMGRLAAHDPRIRVVHNQHNLGFGGAYKRGVAEARCDYVMMICGDNALPADSIRAILKRLGEADIVIPYISNPQYRSPVRRIGSRGFTTIINLLFGLHIRYYNCSVVHRRDVLKTITIVTNGFAYQAEALVKLLRAGHSYVEIGVPNSPRLKGESSALRIHTLLQVFKAIFALVKEVRYHQSMPPGPSLAPASSKPTEK